MACLTVIPTTDLRCIVKFLDPCHWTWLYNCLWIRLCLPKFHLLSLRLWLTSHLIFGAKRLGALVIPACLWSDHKRGGLSQENLLLDTTRKSPLSLVVVHLLGVLITLNCILKYQALLSLLLDLLGLTHLMFAILELDHMIAQYYLGQLLFARNLRYPRLWYYASIKLMLYLHILVFNILLVIAWVSLLFLLRTLRILEDRELRGAWP